MMMRKGDKTNNRRRVLPILLSIAALTAVLGLAYLQAASTLSFRLWRGNVNLEAKNYQEAILWYTRALRLAEGEKEPQRIVAITSRLHRAYEGFCHWDFNGDRLWGWYAGNQIDNLDLRRGALEIGSTGSSPWLEIVHLRLAPNRGYRFRFRMQTATGTQAGLYWAPLTDVFTPDKFISCAVTADGQWHEYTVEMTLLKSEIGKIRFSPINTPGRAAIDWIRILPVDSNPKE